MTEHIPTTVLFVGLGNMGWPMASCLVADGRNVIAFDAAEEQEMRFVREVGGTGLRQAQTLDDVDAVVLMLPTSAIVRQALLGDGTTDALVGRLRHDVVVIDMSSSDPTDTLDLGRTLAGRGIRVVDAPVSGGVKRAADGTLSIMMGADDEDAAARASDVIGPMSGTIFRTGPLGSGHAMKALNNYVAAAAFASASEALIVGSHYGLDPQVMVDVLNASTGRSFMTENSMEQVVSGTYSTGFALGLLDKDVRIAAALAKRSGTPAQVCDAVNARFESATQDQGFAADHSRAYIHWQHEDNSRE